MGDNRTRYNRVRTYLDKVFEKPGGNKARFLNTLAAIISGIVGSGSCQLPKIAERIPGNAKPASVEKRIKRWIDNENIEWEFFSAFRPAVAAESGTSGTCSGNRRQHRGTRLRHTLW